MKKRLNIMSYTFQGFVHRVWFPPSYWMPWMASSWHHPMGASFKYIFFCLLSTTL